MAKSNWSFDFLEVVSEKMSSPDVCRAEAPCNLPPCRWEENLCIFKGSIDRDISQHLLRPYLHVSVRTRRTWQNTVRAGFLCEFTCSNSTEPCRSMCSWYSLYLRQIRHLNQKEQKFVFSADVTVECDKIQKLHWVGKRKNFFCRSAGKRQ